MKILLATDGSENSENAARFLTRFNFSSKDEILILHVVSDIPYPDDYIAQIRHAIKMVSPKILNASADILKSAKARVSTMEEEGYPDTTIIKVAADTESNIVVMGARGLKGVKSLFLGSVTRAVAINSHKPLLVVKPFPSKDAKKIKIIFATDGSPSAKKTSDVLNLLPLPEDTELTIITVVRTIVTDIPDRFSIEIDVRAKEDVARIRKIESERAEGIVDKAKIHLSKNFLEIDSVIKYGDPSVEILKQADAINASLIAVGSRGIRGVKGMLGSVSRRILGHSKCHVLLGK
jgi:nucleotide-binding universal stress UspA family protein